MAGNGKWARKERILWWEMGEENLHQRSDCSCLSREKKLRMLDLQVETVIVVMNIYNDKVNYDEIIIYQSLVFKHIF